MLANFIVRGLQIIFGVIVLGLSIGAVKWQVIGTAPATTGYNAFAGAFGILTALIGIAAAFMEMIPELIMAIVDGLASVIFLAGGIVSPDFSTVLQLAKIILIKVVGFRGRPQGCFVW